MYGVPFGPSQIFLFLAKIGSTRLNCTKVGSMMSTVETFQGRKYDAKMSRVQGSNLELKINGPNAHPIVLSGQVFHLERIFQMYAGKLLYAIIFLNQRGMETFILCENRRSILSYPRVWRSKSRIRLNCKLYRVVTSPELFRDQFKFILSFESFIII